jgi:predicted RNase H-like HicB family nuclease
MTVDKSHGGYVFILEKCGTGYSAYVPDLPGCVTTGRTLQLTKRLMEEAIIFHSQGMREHGLRVPRPRSLETLRKKPLVPVTGSR